MKKILNWSVSFIICLFFVSPGLADVVARPVEYSAGGTIMKGYLAYDDQIGTQRPGVLVVHEWWGHNEYARKRARMLAELGYTALAVDMYGDGKTAQHPDDAGTFASEVSSHMEGIGKERFMAGYEFLKSQSTVDPERIAAIGYCFGGGTVLQMARYGLALKGVVSFHGSLGTNTPAKAGAVKAKILVLTGAEDKMVGPDVVKTFETEMQEAGADYTVITYPGAMHSFTNPDADRLAKEFGLPIAYNKEADQESWLAMKDFLSVIFR